MFETIYPGEGKAAAVIRTNLNAIAAMNHHLREIGNQVGAAAHALLVIHAHCPGGGPERRLARQPGAGDTRQPYTVGVTPSTAQSSIRSNASGIICAATDS